MQYQSILNRLLLHESLIKLDPAYINPSLKNLNLITLKKYCATLKEDENSLFQLRGNLLDDIETLQKSMDNEKAFQVLEIKQNEKIAEVGKLIEDRIQYLKSISLVIFSLRLINRKILKINKGFLNNSNNNISLYCNND